MRLTFCSHPGKLAFGAGGAMDQLDMSGFQELGVVHSVAAQIFLAGALGAATFQDRHIFGQQ